MGNIRVRKGNDMMKVNTAGDIAVMKLGKVPAWMELMIHEREEIKWKKTNNFKSKQGTVTKKHELWGYFL